MTIAYLDIDDFKNVNASLGHIGADRVLSAVGAAMKAAVRSVDVLARVGGDEFALLLPGAERTSAEQILRRVQRRVAEATRSQGGAVSFSIGAVTFLVPPENLEDMLRASDALMYEVKASGKNRILVRESSCWQAGDETSESP